MKRLTLLFLTSLFLSACSTGDKNTETKENTAQNLKHDVEKEELIENKEQDEDTLQIGDSAKIDGIKLIINDVEFIKERIPDHFETFEYVVKLNVTYENTTDTPFPAGRDVIVKANDKEATYYDMEDILLTEVPPHDSVTGPLYYAFNGQPKELVAIFEPLLNTDGESAEFNIMPK